MAQLWIEETEVLAKPVSGGVTYQEFLASQTVDAHTEWVDGEVIVMPPISGEHQSVGLFLLTLVNLYVKELNLGVVRYEPFQMKTGPHLPGRAPDILFVTNAHKKRLKKNHLEGPADLVVEIISPDSRGRDRGEKFFEYETGGVREYWLIDPLRKQAEFYLRGTNGIYQLMQLDKSGIFHSEVLSGLWLDPEWLWQRPLPTEWSVFKKWKLD